MFIGNIVLIFDGFVGFVYLFSFFVLFFFFFFCEGERERDIGSQEIIG